jgi:hypothetical protein
MKRNGWIVTWMLVLALGTLACSDSPPGPGGAQGTVSLSFMLPGGSGAAAAAFADGPLVLGPDGNGNTLEIVSAEVVLREIEFELAESLSGCDSDEGELEGSDDDSCEEFEAGPQLVSLPLTPGVVMTDVMVQDVPAGDYEEIELDIHKVGDDAADLAFLEDHDGFEGISVKVVYTWNGGAEQVFTSGVDAEQELEAPFSVAPGQTEVGVTLTVDVSSWFVDGSGDYIDPSTASDGGVNKSRVEGNIESSFDAFEDDDHDGVPHDEDSDEHDDD